MFSHKWGSDYHVIVIKVHYIDIHVRGDTWCLHANFCTMTYLGSTIYCAQLKNMRVCQEENSKIHDVGKCRHNTCCGATQVP